MGADHQRRRAVDRAVPGQHPALHRRQLHHGQRADPEPHRRPQPDHRRLIGSFQPKPDATVRAIAATSDTVYFGGLLSAVGGVARTRVAAVRASDGALLSWAPNAQGGSVHALALSPTGSQVLVGGSFTTMNGSSNPGYGLASVSPATGALLPLAANSLVRNGGANAAITGLSVDATASTSPGYVFGSRRQPRGRRPDRLERWRRQWVEDCHGDTYGTFPRATSSTRPATRTTAATCRTASRRPTRGPSTTAPPSPRPPPARSAAIRWATSTGRATPAPTLLNWFPALTNGTFTGQGQAAWNVTGNADYVAIGGEFPRAGGVAAAGPGPLRGPRASRRTTSARRSPARGSTRT